MIGCMYLTSFKHICIARYTEQRYSYLEEKKIKKYIVIIDVRKKQAVRKEWRLNIAGNVDASTKL